MMYKYITLFIFCLVFATSNAQEQSDSIQVTSDSLHVKNDSLSAIKKIDNFYNRLFYKVYGQYFPKDEFTPYDSTYIKFYPKHLTVTMYSLYPSLSFRITPNNGTHYSEYKANLSNVLGFSVSYKTYSVSYGFKIAPDVNESKDLTSTSYSIFKFDFYNNRFNQQVGYTNLSGLTDINPENNLDTTRKYNARGDIRFTSYDYTMVYNFRYKKYSYIAPRTFLQRQIKSSYSPFLKIGAYYQRIKADSSLLSQMHTNDQNDFKGVNKISGLLLKIAPGIGGSLVLFKNVYLNGNLFFGANYFLYKLTRPTNEVSKIASSFVMTFDADISLGVNTKRFYYGLYLDIVTTSYIIDEATMVNYNLYSGAKIGYRFNTPKIIDKIFNVIIPY